MRIAIVSDIHGNLTAFEAVVADLRHTSPDLIFHGGDLADGGASPAQVVDRIRDLGWQGVVGNTDEMLFDAGSLTEFASQSSQNLQPLFTALEVRAAATREAIGEERLAWLRTLPRIQFHDRLALVHASPKSLWRAPSPEAGDAELEGVYSPLDRTVTVYGHIHRSYIRKMPGMTVANSGSVSLSDRASGGSSMTWKRRSRRFKFAAFPTPAGSLACSAPQAFKCLDSRILQFCAALWSSPARFGFVLGWLASEAGETGGVAAWRRV